ncbi:MAG: metallophosphoesterase [Clostridia bacterium]|nr:metallophosphoesterase [Clostridia bacterium]
MIYYISDLHFGHRNVLEMDHRPFADIDEMDAALIRLWNERVTDTDDVYIVGDFAYRNGYTASWYLRRLNGRKHLIIGNHDFMTIQDEKALARFASVEKMARIMDQDRQVSLCHFPVAEWNGKRRGGYHVFGHLHGRRDEVYQFMSRYDHALNAGCMLNGYRPVTLDELMENNRLFRQTENPLQDA